MNTTLEVQSISIWMLLWLMMGLPFLVLFVMYLRKKRKISRVVGAILSVVGLSGSVAWPRDLWAFVFFTFLLFPAGYVGMLIAESMWDNHQEGKS